MVQLAASAVASLKDANSRLLREDIAQGRVEFRALPEVVTLNHTDLCNLRCIMCPRNLAQGTHRLSRRVLGYLAEELFPTARKLVLTTSGGEPLGADFDFLLERALAHEVVMDVVTNGVLLTLELYRHARPAFDHLNVSLDSHVPEVYERIRLGGRFETVHSHLLAIQEERRTRPDDVLYSTSAVVMRSNLPHLPEFVDHAAALGFDAVVFQRLLHSVKPTPEEEPLSGFSEAQVLATFERAGAAARRRGVNLYLSEFGLPPVLVRPLRAKRPDPILGQRMCWFTAQNFGVMYTGEVYPCCIPTDHLLGNVLYEAPTAIWNGRRFQALRRAQLSGRGTLFCSGCLHAPHLKARRLAPVTQAGRVVRRAIQHVLGGVERKLSARYATQVIDPPPPRTVEREGGFQTRVGAIAARVLADLRNEVAAVSPVDGALLLIRDGDLLCAATPEAAPRRIALLPEAEGRRATTLRFVASDVVVIAFHEQGRLFRLRLDSTPRLEEALVLSSPRAFVRQFGVAVVRSGALFVGEYGVYPGARCGRVHRADHATAPFRLRLDLPWARHVHTLFARPRGGLLVTTGDLAGCRKLLALPERGGRPRVIERAWAGYTAIAESESAVHFGTELRDSNALLRRDRRLRAPAELRRLPAQLDLQVRDLVDLGGGRLIALLGMDADLVDRREGRRAALLLSRDDGRSWELVHEFAADWSDAPEALLCWPGPRARVLTQCSDRPVLFEIP